MLQGNAEIFLFGVATPCLSLSSRHDVVLAVGLRVRSERSPALVPHRGTEGLAMCAFRAGFLGRSVISVNLLVLGLGEGVLVVIVVLRRATSIEYHAVRRRWWWRIGGPARFNVITTGGGIPRQSKRVFPRDVEVLVDQGCFMFQRVECQSSNEALDDLHFGRGRHIGRHVHLSVKSRYDHSVTRGVAPREAPPTVPDDEASELALDEVLLVGLFGLLVLVLASPTRVELRQTNEGGAEERHEYAPVEWNPEALSWRFTAVFVGVRGASVVVIGKPRAHGVVGVVIGRSTAPQRRVGRRNQGPVETFDLSNALIALASRRAPAKYTILV